MPHLYKKKAQGRTYWYLRETVREGRKVRVKWQKYLGTPETLLAKLEKAEVDQTPLRIRSEEFGSVFLVNELEKMVDTIGITDSIVAGNSREKGPSVGEYFFYAWANRLIEPKSKNTVGEWFGRTAIDSLRNVKTKDLNSKRYWDKWDRVSREQVEAIGRAFFQRVWEKYPRAPECVLFDTTNYYSYIASDTESGLFERGYNKSGKHHLRQIGLALLVDSNSRLPIYYREYAGNEHDSQVFNQVIDEMFGVLCGFNGTKQRLTVVFDKGMNSEDNVALIDDHKSIHFITTYSTYFAEDLASTDLKHFSPLKIRHNDELIEKGNAADCMLGYRTKLELWGKERTVVVTFNPMTQRKKFYKLEEKIESIRQALLFFRRNYRERRPHWRNFETIVQRYHRLCEQLHIGSQYYKLEQSSEGRDLSFRKDSYQIGKAKALFGKNIIVTDNTDWSTEDIVQASLDRWGVEKAFRDTKSRNHISAHPMYHWTDSKIRCHLLTCVIALTMSRLLELKMEPVLGRMSTEKIIEEMRALRSLLVWYPKKRNPQQQLEEPTAMQNDVLKALGYIVDDSWVLQRLTS
ncbi:MAG: IS1634 family transposase [Chloroflexota bacterium]|nr:IS1634 family transposase [Chloroflexota bacterium]